MISIRHVQQQQQCLCRSSKGSGCNELASGHPTVVPDLSLLTHGSAPPAPAGLLYALGWVVNSCSRCICMIFPVILLPVTHHA